MSEQKPVLLALSKPDDIGKISKGLMESELVFEHAGDGAEAMDFALKNPPSAVVCDVAIGGMTADRLFNNIKNNPDTATVPFIFLSDQVTEIKGFRPRKDAILVRPFHWGELHGILKQALLAGKEDEGAKHIKGNLAHMSLVDLLQVLHFNQKEGVLTIEGQKETGKILLKGGQIFNATLGDCEKEKALFRFFTWKEGDFEFVPEPVTITQKITTSTGNLLMEGARQFDEFERDKRKFPKDSSTLKVNVDTNALPKGLKPIISEILFLIQYYPTVREVVDHCMFPDYDVYTTLVNLIAKNVLTEVKEANEKAFSEDFISPAQAVRIKEMITAKWGENLNVNFGRVFIIASSTAATEALIGTFSKLPGFHPYRDPKTSMTDDFFIGELGSVSLYGDLEAVLFAVPYSAEMLPLVSAFSPNLLGLIVLVDENFSKVSQDMISARSKLSSKRRIPMLHVVQSTKELGNDEVAYMKRLISLKPEEEFLTFIPGQKETVYVILKTFFEKLAKEDMFL